MLGEPIKQRVQRERADKQQCQFRSELFFSLFFFFFLDGLGCFVADALDLVCLIEHGRMQDRQLVRLW